LAINSKPSRDVFHVNRVGKPTESTQSRLGTERIPSWTTGLRSDRIINLAEKPITESLKASALNDTNQYHYDRDDQENVNKSSYCVRGYQAV